MQRPKPKPSWPPPIGRPRHHRCGSWAPGSVANSALSHARLSPAASNGNAFRRQEKSSARKSKPGAAWWRARCTGDKRAADSRARDLWLRTGSSRCCRDHATPRSCHTPPSFERDVIAMEPASPHCCAPTDLTADVPAGQRPVRASSFLGGPSLDAVAHVSTVDGCSAGNGMGQLLGRQSQATSGRCVAARDPADR